MNMRTGVLLVLSLLLSVPAAAVELRGQVRAASGPAVEHAEVSDLNRQDWEVFTDRRGAFTIPECELPCLLLVRHPRFVDQVVQVLTAPAGELEIILEPKQELYEQIVVTANRSGGDSLAPVSIASRVVRVGDKVTLPGTLTELVEGVPGVAENGQGGIFQVFSIRGVSRHRVLTMVAGIPLAGERRAGVSASFIDPLLLGGVDVLRGPASTWYGSGALGGVVQVFPRHFEKGSVEAGWESFGDASYLAAGLGVGDWSLGLAHRRATNDLAADGSELNSHFTQFSATVARRWQVGERSYELLVLPARSRDVGKAATDFPERITNYPEENHLLVRFAMSGTGGWRLQTWAHPNEVTTEVREAGTRSMVFNEALDFGANWQRELQLLGAVGGRMGVDYVARRGVEAREVDATPGSGPSAPLQTLDGGQDEAAAYASLHWNWRRATIQAGSRLTWQAQRNCGRPERDDTAWTGFLGFVQPLGGGVELSATVGTGLRFPNLSERYYTGITGRGGVIGNPDLKAESSLNADVGLRWFGARTFLGGHLFRMRIADYVERVEIDEDLLSWVNLTSGTIAGAELEGFFELTDRWYLDWAGHLLAGEDTGGNPLADVPANRAQLGLRYRAGDWEGRIQYQYRHRKRQPGSDEKAIPPAHLVSLAVRYAVGNGLALTLRGENLLAEEYFNAADKKAPMAPGRSLGLSLAWSR